MLAALGGAVLAAGLAIAPQAAAAAPRPTAVVVLGDSAASGEGAGDYEPGTRGENGNWCHRSVHAYVHRTGLAEQSVNLACSGAEAADVGFAAPGHHTEGSQAARLVDVARTFRVTTVILQVGGNDDPELIATGVACIRAFIDPRVPPCRETLGPKLTERVAAMTDKVAHAARDVRTAMRRAGYRDGDYAFVIASYAATVTEQMVPLHAVAGCPYSRADAEWGRTVVFPAVAAGLREVADRTGARFLDFTRATAGHEACSRPLMAEEWHRRITVDPNALVYGRLDALGWHLFQESYHPNAAGHAEMGRCVAEFVRSGAKRGSCVVGPDGHAHATTTDPAAPAAI